MGRYFQTADYKPTIDFLYEPDWALTERVLKTEQKSLDAQREQIEAWKNLQIEHLGGAADAENSKRILDYIRNVADEYSNAIEADKLDARAYTPNLKNFQNELLKNYREGDIARIQSSPAALRAWEKEHEKFKESHPEYYAHARQKFLDDYHNSGGNSLVRGWQGQALARPIDVEKVTQHAYKLMAEKTGWTRDTTDGTWINSNGHKVESLEANRVFQNIMGTILADPANQAFMRQSTELGWMRYLDDKGNVDYNSPGLNPYNSIAQSISYKHDQKDHSMRADDYGKMAKQHQYDVAMENLRYKNAKALKKYEKELENPPELPTVGSFIDSAFETPEQLKEALQSDNPELRNKAIAMVTSTAGEHLKKYLDPEKDGKIYNAVLDYYGKHGGNVPLGDAYQHVINTQFGGYYLTNNEKVKLILSNNQDLAKVEASKVSLEKTYRNGSITKGQYEKAVALQNQKIKDLKDDNKKILDGKRPKSHVGQPTFWQNIVGQDVETSRKLAYNNYNDDTVSALNKVNINTIHDRYTNNNNVVTFTPVDKKTSGALVSSIMGTDGAIAKYNEKDKVWEQAPKNSIEGYTVVGSYPMTSTGEIALKVRDSKGKEDIVKINSSRNQFFGDYSNRLIAQNAPKDFEAQTRNTPTYQKLATHFNANNPNEGKASYVSTYATSSRGDVYKIVSGEGKFSIVEMPKNISNYSPVNNVYENQKSFNSGTQFDNLIQVAAYLNTK